MRLYKLADLFEKKLSLATNQAYEHLAKINSKIADLAGADISEPAVRKLVDNLAHSARFLADKAWRSGVSAEELRSKVEALKSKTNLLAMTLSAHQLPGLEPQASEIMSLLGTQPLVAIPGSVSSGVAMEQDPVGENQTKLDKVVQDLESRHDYHNPSLEVQWNPEAPKPVKAPPTQSELDKVVQDLESRHDYTNPSFEWDSNQDNDIPFGPPPPPKPVPQKPAPKSTGFGSGGRHGQNKPDKVNTNPSQEQLSNVVKNLGKKHEYSNPSEIVNWKTQ